ncbi:MAG: AI-2E family transporter [Oscillospiraceae bacterium]|nr:AI-2E family transporter [Oscillospiraceae bacterium]
MIFVKFNWSDEVKTKIISNSLIAIIAISFYFLIGKITILWDAVNALFDLLSPFFIGFVIAYLFVRPVCSVESFLEKYVFKKSKKKVAIRGLSIGIVVIFFLALFAFIISLIIPEIIESVLSLAKNADGYINGVNEFLSGIANKHGIKYTHLSDFIGSSQELFKNIMSYAADALPEILDFSISIGSGISNFFIGFILALYMLSNKELFAAQTKKIIYAFFPKRATKETLSTFRFLHETFGKYLSSQILDSIILGFLVFICMSIFGMEYALLISLIITISNLIPFIGPIIGTIPSFCILLMVDPIKALWFLVMILVLQQFDANVMQPKIVGKTTGLSSFWVILSVIIGGALFGVMGVFLAVPAFSVLYTFAKRYVEKRLKERNLSPKTKDYY